MTKLVFAAIDVSMKQLVVAVQGVEKTLEFDNDEAGHKALVRALKKRRVRRVAIEPTGNYGFDVMLALTQANVEVMSVNPRAARNFAKANMRRGKTDKVDAFMLLEFATRMEFVAWNPPRPSIIELRAISRRIQQVVKMAAAEKARLKAIQATATAPQVVLESLEAAITALDASAEALVQAGLTVADQDPELHQAIANLTSIRGVADRTAVKVLGELATLPPDLTARQLVAMAGLDPRPFESGMAKGRRRISKLGNSHIRGILYMAAHNAAMYEPVVRQMHAELIARQKHHMAATVAVMRKLLQAFWAMIRTNSAFRPELFRRDSIASAA